MKRGTGVINGLAILNLKKGKCREICFKNPCEINFKNQKLAIFTKKMYAGRVRTGPPAINFLVKLTNFNFYISFSLKWNSSKLHISAKFSMANLLFETVFHLIQ